VLQFIRRRHPIEKVETVLASAGFEAPTPLQKEYVPAALRGRDLIVECTSGEGKTIAQLLPYLFRPRGRRKAPSILILIDSIAEAMKYKIEMNRLPADQTGNGSAVILGKNTQAKADLQLLAKRQRVP